jgi:hypothetical protein
MRTPWRFVADLVSRRPDVDKIGDARHARADDVKAIAHQPVVDAPAQKPAETVTRDPVDHGGTRPVDEIETSLSSNAPHISGVADDAPDALGAEDSRVQADIDKQALDAAESASKTGEPDIANSDSALPVEKGVLDQHDAEVGDGAATAGAPVKPRRGKRVAKPVVTPAAGEQIGVAEPVAAKTVVEELAELDTEIAALRRQLSQKLVRENEHLRNLLNRYGV